MEAKALMTGAQHGAEPGAEAVSCEIGVPASNNAALPLSDYLRRCCLKSSAVAGRRLSSCEMWR